MRAIWKIAPTLMLIAAPAMAEPIRLRCDNLNISRPDPAVYSVLEIDLGNNSITQVNYHRAGSNKVPYQITAADEATISAVSDHEGTREMRINRTSGRVDGVWHYRSITTSSGYTSPAGVMNFAFECKPLKPVF